MVQLYVKSKAVTELLAKTVGNKNLTGYAAFAKLEEDRDGTIAAVDTLRKALDDNDDYPTVPIYALIAAFDDATEGERKLRKRASRLVAKGEATEWSADESREVHDYIDTLFTLRYLGGAIAREAEYLRKLYAASRVKPGTAKPPKRRSRRRAT